jgi:predicted Zn-dependent protease
LARAQAYGEAGMYRPALLDYNTYYDAVNGNVNDLFYYYREQAANKAHQYQQALDDIQAAIDLKPKEMLYRVEQGAMNLRVNRIDVAVKQLQEAIKIDPKFAETYRILGLCQIEQKKNQEACANFAKAKELGDENAQPLIDKYCK